MQTGQIIAKLRTQMGITQTQLADALFVSRDLVSKWEMGKRFPEYKLVLEMAELFSVDPELLMAKDALLLEELSELLPKRYPVSGERLQKDLNAFLATLSARDAGIFVLRYYFCETPGEIGERYGVKEDYVRTILMRVRKKLKKYLKEE